MLFLLVWNEVADFQIDRAVLSGMIPRHKNGLKAFKEEHPDCMLILVSLDPISRFSGDIERLYVNDFLKMLWNGEII